MTEPSTRAPDAPEEPAPAAALRRRAGAGVLAAGAFVAGLLAGAIALALIVESPPAGLAGPRDAVATPTGTTPDPGSGAAAGVRVNDACLRVVNAAQDSLGAIEDVGQAAADLDLARLSEVVRRLQPLQDRLRTNLQDCRVDGELAEDVSPSATPGEGSGQEGD